MANDNNINTKFHLTTEGMSKLLPALETLATKSHFLTASMSKLAGEMVKSVQMGNPVSEDGVAALQAMVKQLMKAEDHQVKKELFGKALGMSKIGYNNYEDFSSDDKQVLDLIAKNAAQNIEDLFVKSFTPEPPVMNLSGIVTLFETAKKKLLLPKIRLQLGGMKVFLSIGGKKSNHPGQVLVYRKDPYVSLGHISLDGKWHQHKIYSTSSQEFLKAIDAGLLQFSQDPSSVAYAQGAFTKECCFCGKKLSDPASKQVGFGPVCAEKYGLQKQWGASPASAFVKPNGIQEYLNVDSSAVEQKVVQEYLDKHPTKVVIYHDPNPSLTLSGGKGQGAWEAGVVGITQCHCFLCEQVKPCGLVQQVPVCETCLAEMGGSL